MLNPTVIVEILSPFTESFDRGEKCLRYQTWNPSLRDDSHVAPDRAIVEQFTRQADERWELQRCHGLEGALEFPSVHCRLLMADIYEGVALRADGGTETVPPFAG